MLDRRVCPNCSRRHGTRQWKICHRCGFLIRAENVFWPTPQEIAEATARIRESWSEEEHRRRAGIRDRALIRGEYELPVVRRLDGARGDSSI